MTEPEWSDWVPFAEALAHAPRLPGVYMAREGPAGSVVYIGMAGERKGSGKPQGIRGRLAIYASGKGLASGLGEAVFDRALADATWLGARLAELETRGPRRAKHWGTEAFNRADIYVCWTTTIDRRSALELENQLIAAAGAGLWNKASARLATLSVHGARLAMPVALTGDPLSQRVTTNDLDAGRIRIPIRHKSWFPVDAQWIDILLRGELVSCSWNPAPSPDRQRSGVLRPPGETLRRLVPPDEFLMISSDGALVSLT